MSVALEVGTRRWFPRFGRGPRLLLWEVLERYRLSTTPTSEEFIQTHPPRVARELLNGRGHTEEEFVAAGARLTLRDGTTCRRSDVVALRWTWTSDVCRWGLLLPPWISLHETNPVDMHTEGVTAYVGLEVAGDADPSTIASPWFPRGVPRYRYRCVVPGTNAAYGEADWASAYAGTAAFGSVWTGPDGVGWKRVGIETDWSGT